MNKSYMLWGIIIIAVLAIVGFMYTSQSTNVSNVSNIASNQPSQSTTTTSQSTVTYTDSGFSPATITINKGDTVTFKNSASDDMRVASNPHPLHNGYPTTGGCVSSTFDSCKNIHPGESWSFAFDMVGTWGYHNHLNPSEGGTVVVK